MTTAAGVSARAALMSIAASRSSMPLRSQYSPSTATRRNAGVRRLMLLASLNASGAGPTITVVGSKVGNQMSGARSPRSCGSTGKPEPPASRQPLWEVGFGGSPSGSCSKVAIVVGIAAEEFPCKLGATESLHVSVGGGISPVRCCWHVGPRNGTMRSALACKCG
jgi:hypothetical protein